MSVEQHLLCSQNFAQATEYSASHSTLDRESKQRIYASKYRGNICIPQCLHGKLVLPTFAVDLSGKKNNPTTLYIQGMRTINTMMH